MELTKEMVQEDYAASQRDIEYLKLCIQGMTAFINNPCGESRGFLRTNLMKWEDMLSQAQSLDAKIKKKLDSL